MCSSGCEAALGAGGRADGLSRGDGDAALRLKQVRLARACTATDAPLCVQPCSVLVVGGPWLGFGLCTVQQQGGVTWGQHGATGEAGLLRFHSSAARDRSPSAGVLHRLWSCCLCRPRSTSPSHRVDSRMSGLMVVLAAVRAAQRPCRPLFV